MAASVVSGIEFAKISHGLHPESAHNRRVWEAAREALLRYLTMRDFPDGPYSITAAYKVRMKAQGERIKLSRHEHGSLVFVVRTRDDGNGDVYEYKIRGLFQDWDAESIFNEIRAAENAEPTDDEEVELGQLQAHELTLTTETPADPPEVTTTPDAPAPAVPLVEPVVVPSVSGLIGKLQALQAIANRNVTRQERLTTLQGKILNFRDEIVRVQAHIAELEEQALGVMTEMEQDQECRDAIATLNTMSSLFK